MVKKTENTQSLTTQVYIQASIRNVFAAIRQEIKQHHADSLSKGTVLKEIDKVESELRHRYESEPTSDPKQEENDPNKPENETESEPENTD